MKRHLRLIILVVSVALAACAKDAGESTVMPTATQTSAPSATPAPTEPPALPPTPPATATPTPPATEAAFVSIMPTPTRTPTVTPTPTPWPTLTPLPAAPPATPVMAGLPELGIDWIEAAGYWRPSWGRGELPQTLQGGDTVIVAGRGAAPVQAFSLQDGTEQWRYPALPASETNDAFYSIRKVVLAGDQVVLDTTQGMQAIAATDGQRVWSDNGIAEAYLVAATDSALYMRDFETSRKIIAIDPTTRQERWRYDCLNDSYTRLLATTEWLFVACKDDAGQESLVRLSVATGELAGVRSLPEGGFALLSYLDGVVLVMGYTRPNPGSGWPAPYQLTALDWDTDQTLWKSYVTSPDAVKVDGDAVLIAAGNQLQRLSARDGQSQWITTLPVDDRKLRVAQALVDGEALLIGSDSGLLYALDMQTGDLLWMEDLWGQLGLPWRPVLPLVMQDDSIVVWLSLADGNAVAGLRRGASASPWPTPTFVPDSVLQMPAPTAAPAPSGTPVPADWTPEPVQWDPTDASESYRVEREMRDMLFTWLDLHPGDYGGFNRQVSEWPSRSYAGEGTFHFPSNYVSWAHQADLDGDGSQEDIIALGVWRKTWAVLKDDGQQTRITYASEPGFDYLRTALEFVLADDINCDGQVEIVLQWRGINTAGDFVHAFVSQWDGNTWRELGSAYSAGYAEPSIEFVDTDGDGCLEAVGNYTPSHQAPTRPQTLIFAFRDGRYQQVDAVGDPSHLGYFKVIDANRELARGNLDGALELAMQALKDPETGMSSQGGLIDVDRYEARIAAYAAAEAMLVHALRGERDAMPPLLQQIKTTHDRTDNPFLPATRALWETYDATGDAQAACRAMEKVVRLWGDTELVQYGSERLTIEQICPLD